MHFRLSKPVSKPTNWLKMMWKHFRNNIVLKSRLRNYDLETNYQQSSIY